MTNLKKRTLPKPSKKERHSSAVSKAGQCVPQPTQMRTNLSVRLAVGDSLATSRSASMRKSGVLATKSRTPSYVFV